MRIAIHNHYAGQEVAETEFARKICRAASNLGWEAAEVGVSAEINQFHPDFVLALHFRTPKLTQYPTYGSMVNPPAYFLHDDRFVKNVLSYDGYFSSSDHITAWLKDILYETGKKYLLSPFYTSCQSVSYRPPRISQPRLLYVGTNWDGPRHQELFRQLDMTPSLDIYGPRGGWSYLHQSYRGVLPFDGSSIFEALNQAGVGLCLHRAEHCAAATPSTRIFEIAASGAIAICQEHSFIRRAFGDSVLYFDDAASPKQAASQISKYMHWIKENPEQALTLSKKAYDIFARDFTLEKLLSDVVPHHQRLVEQKGFAISPTRRSPKGKTVQFIVRVGERSTRYIHRALDSLAAQTEGRIGVLLVRYGEVPRINELREQYADRLAVEIVESPRTRFRSAQLWAGLNRISAEYFGILDDDDILHPNHVHSLLQALGQSEKCGVAYSGSIRVWEADPNGSTESPPDVPQTERAELTYFEPFDLNRLVTLENFITSNAFIARSSLLKRLGDDPQLPLLEDLFLLLYLCRHAEFAFSYEATCEFYWRDHKKDNTAWRNPQDWVSANEKIKTLLWGQAFDFTQTVGLSKVARLDDLSRLESRLSHVESRLGDRLIQLETNLAQTDAKLEVATVNLAQTDAKLEVATVNLAQMNAKLDATTTRFERYANLPFINVVRRLRRMLLRLPPPQIRD